MVLRRAILTTGCALFLAACGTNEDKNFDIGQACTDDTSCRAPYVCLGPDGTKICTLEQPDVCKPGSTRCLGDFLQTCDSDTAARTAGKRWIDASAACPAGCGMVIKDNAPTAACLPQPCEPGASRCEGPNIIVMCDPSGSSEFVYTSCATGCVQQGTTAQCANRRCRPYETSCKDGDPTKLLTCDSRGVQNVESDCPTVGSSASICVAGRCLAKVCDTTTSGGNTVRQQRCNGAIREECNDTSTGWRAIEVCALGCEINSTTNNSQCLEPGCKPTPTSDPVGPYASVCDSEDPTGTRLLTCDARGAVWEPTDCSTLDSPHVCVAGACVPKACSVTRDGTGAITAREQRCNGFVAEQCADAQDGFDAKGAACQFGCTIDTAGNAVCADPECQFNGGGALAQSRCVGNTIERCNVYGVFAFERFCSTGCTVGSNGQAGCAPNVCPPLTRTCSTDANGAFVQICKADGTGRETLERCPQGCQNGKCEVTDDTCTPGALRCAAASVETCVSLPNGATAWRYVQTCLDGCVAGVCQTPSACGCTGSNAPPALECGTAGRMPITLKVVASAADTNLPCDGASTFLVYSDPITSAGGSIVPDGTLVTFSATGTGTAEIDFVSGDADPTRPGLQRPTRRGVAKVTVASPASCTGIVDQGVAATIESSCGGSLTLHFAAPAPDEDGNINSYVTEDFSTTTFRDPLNTQAAWDTTSGSLTGTPIFNTGTGADGDITVGTGNAGTGTIITNLADIGYGRAVDVISVGDRFVTTPINLPPFAPGDEAVLWTQYSSNPDRVGTFEFRRIASIGTGRVIFTEAVTKAYGTSGGLAGDRVVLMRVPNFSNVFIRGNGVLTTSAPDALPPSAGSGTGFLAFRATATVSVIGLIDMNGKGYTGLPNPGSPRAADSLPRLILGNGGDEGAGGGIVFIAAGRIEHLNGTTVVPAPEGTIRASGTGTVSLGGFAGVIWTAAGEFMVGTNNRSGGDPYQATTPGSRGSGGQIRNDYITTDASSAHWSTPVAFSAQTSGFTTTSGIARTYSGSGAGFKKVQLLAGVAGIGNDVTYTPVGLQTQASPSDPTVALPGVTLEISPNSGNTWFQNIQLGDPADVGAAAGRNNFRWRLKMNPIRGQPVEIDALTFRLGADP